MTNPVVLYELKPPAVVLTINRPDRRNALNRQLVTELHAAFTRAERDHLVRHVVLTGAGTAFCAGMDLAELSATLNQPNEAEIVRNDAERLSLLYDVIYSLPKPTIAAVNGPAVAGGAGSGILELLANCGRSLPTLTLGIPDQFVEHGSREDCLVAAELDQASLESAVRRWWEHQSVGKAMVGGT